MCFSFRWSGRSFICTINKHSSHRSYTCWIKTQLEMEISYRKCMYETPGWGWLHYITSSHIVVNVVEESISVGIKTEFCFKWSLSYPPRTMAMLAKGYGPIRRLMFDGDEAKYDLWEIKFLGFMRLHKLHEVILTEGTLDEEMRSRTLMLWPNWSSV